MLNRVFSGAYRLTDPGTLSRSLRKLNVSPAKEPIWIVHFLGLVEVEALSPSRRFGLRGRRSIETGQDGRGGLDSHVGEYSRHDERGPPKRALDVGRSSPIESPREQL